MVFARMLQMWQPTGVLLSNLSSPPNPFSFFICSFTLVTISLFKPQVARLERHIAF